MSFVVDEQAKKLGEVQKLANELLREFGLWDWKFVYSNHYTFVGYCWFHTKEIQYSTHYLLETPMEEIEDTIRHEIAHALVGPRHGHDEVWRAKCIEIGARPERLVTEAVSTKMHTYLMTCPVCGREWKRHRMRRRNYGSKCPDCMVVVTIENVKTGEILYEGGDY